jgi:mono/diheme cytochrome c family protein
MLQPGGTGGFATPAAGSSGTTGGGGSGPLDGAALYAANCMLCHGQQGAGGVLAPETQHPVRDYSSWVVRHGRPGVGFPKPMDIFGPDKLSDANLSLIWDYLDLPAQPTTGQALYHDYCANCHGADGKAGPTMRSITNELAKLKDQIRKGSKPGLFDQRHDYMPAFAASRLSDAEVALIYTYVDSL